MNNNWFVSSSPLNEKQFLDDLHYGSWISTHTLISPTGHMELGYLPHMISLMIKACHPLKNIIMRLHEVASHN